jgi:tyrosinase
MSPVAEVRPRAVAATVKLRKNIALMTEAELTAYRNAVTALQARNDNLGWQYFAGWHGVPQGWCQHHNSIFLPWHRSYLYHLELALQSVDASVTIPWWDWMSDSTIPAAFDGAAAQNPLGVGNPIAPIGIAPRPDWPTETTRDPGGAVGNPGVPPLPYGAAYNRLMRPTDYEGFWPFLAQLHDAVHVWTGGTMSDPEWAAFDPLFFSHHAMVDRLWRIWQVANPGGAPAATILDTSLTSTRPIFNVRDVLNVQALGYDYAASSASVAGTLGGS